MRLKSWKSFKFLRLKLKGTDTAKKKKIFMNTKGYTVKLWSYLIIKSLPLRSSYLTQTKNKIRYPNYTNYIKTKIYIV